MMRHLFAVLMVLLADPAMAREPVIDMHLHALAADDQGPPPLALCTPMDPMPTWDNRQPWTQAFVDYLKHPPCRDPIWSPLSNDAVRDRSLAEMRRWNVIGTVSGPMERLRDWHTREPERVLFGVLPDDDELSDAPKLTADLVSLKTKGELTVVGEVGAEYAGIAPDDKRLEGLWQAAEAMDVPVALHVGPGPPGTAYLPGMGYRARMSNPLLLEDVLVHHPRLRLQVMHAGYPMLDEMLALLYAHPQVYVDTGVIVWTQPRPAFYHYLRTLVEAGFGKRIMFGSDQMVWPEAIGRSIKVIEDAPFLSRAQKRDILYNNAARFLRLDAATIARHRAM